ncbi:hypothetical protein BJY04DRAFT_213679 [Aspergillus karnatakaensis]|uniref:uncharacterized protein n=1 Tax=Aspergillus karnatakaensis TaxID=1810916 RepID=UPI003CCD625E
MEPMDLEIYCCHLRPEYELYYTMCTNTYRDFIPESALRLPLGHVAPIIGELTTTANIDINTHGPVIARAVRNALTGSIERLDGTATQVYVWVSNNSLGEGYRISFLADIPEHLVHGFSDRMQTRLPEGITGEDGEQIISFESDWQPYLRLRNEEIFEYRLKWFTTLGAYDKANLGPFLFWTNYRLPLDGNSAGPEPVGELPFGSFVYRP